MTLAFSLPAFADKKIAVLPFNTHNATEDIKQFSFGTMASINHTLSGMEEYTVIDRGQIENILKEIGFQKTGLTEKDQVKAGKLFGVDVLVLGTIQKSNNNYRINLNFTDVQTGKIIKTFQVTGNEIFDLQDKLAIEILKDTKLTAKDIIKTTSSDAYNYFIKAKDLTNTFNKENMINALSLLNQAIKIDNNYLEAYAERAKVNAVLSFILKKGNQTYLDKMSNAELDAEKVLNQDENNIDAYLALYIVGETAGRRDELGDIFYKAQKINSFELAAINYSIADYFYTKKNYKESEYFFKKSIEADSKYIYSYFTLGNMYNNQKKQDQAIDIYKRGLQVDPKYTLIKINLGNLYVEKQQYDLALKEYKEVIEISPDDFTAHSSIASLLGSKNDYKGALEEYKKSIEANKDFAGNYSAIGHLYLKLNELDLAYENFKKALALDPNNSYTTYGIALYYGKKGDIKKAVDLLKNLEKNSETKSKYIEYIANLYLESKMYNELANEMNSYLAKNKEYTLGYFQLAKAYRNLKKYDLEISSLKAAMSTKDLDNEMKENINSDLKDSYLLYGIEKYKETKYEDAIDLYNKAINISADVSTYNNIGVSYYMLQKYDKAIEQYKKALQINPNHADSRNNLGMTFEVLGKKNEAAAEYKKACDLGVKDKCGFK